MKVYNRKLYNAGLLFICIGVVKLTTIIINQESFYEYLGIFFLFTIGIYKLYISLSKVRNEKRENGKDDERNQLVHKLSMEKTFGILRCIFLVLGTFFLILGSIYKSDIILAFGISQFLIFTISLIIEFVCFVYYNSKL